MNPLELSDTEFEQKNLGVTYANISSAHLANRFFRKAESDMAVRARNIGSVGLSAPIVLASRVRRRAKRSFLWSLFLLALTTLSGALFPLLSLTQELRAQEISQDDTSEDLTLARAISIGLENNYQIKIADKFIAIAENNNTWGRAGRLPTVSLSATWNNNYSETDNPASFIQGALYNSDLGVAANANLLLYAGGRVRIAKEQLELAQQQQELLKSNGVANLIRDISEQYYTVLLNEQNEDVFSEVLNLSKQRLDYENTKKEFGASNSYNLIQFQNAMAADSTNLVAQITRTDIAKQNLYNTLNLLGFPDYNYPENFETVVENLDKEKLRELLEEENFTLRTLFIANDLNKLNRRLAEAARKPTISAFANAGFNEGFLKLFQDNPETGEPFDGVFNNRWNVGFGLTGSWNLYDGGVQKIDIQNARIQEEIGDLDLLEAKASLVNQLNILVRSYNNQKELLALTETQLNLSKNNLEISEERFKGGQISSLDYQNAQNQYLLAAFSRVNAIYNLILSKNDLDWLVGVYGSEANNE